MEWDGVAIAVAQFAPGADAEANALAIREFATIAAARGAKLVVFPEYSSYFVAELGQDFVDAAEPIDGEFIGAVRAAAVDLGIHIVVGLVEQIEEPARFSNTLLAISPQGDVVAVYRKLHLYDAFGATESNW